MRSEIYPVPFWTGDEAGSTPLPPCDCLSCREKKDHLTPGEEATGAILTSFVFALPVAIVFSLGCWWQGWNPFFGFLGSLFGLHVAAMLLLWWTRPKPAAKGEGYPEL